MLLSLSYDAASQALAAGVEQLASAGILSLSPDGFPVRVVRGDHLSLDVCEDGAQIVYAEKTHFFRMLGMLLEGRKHVTETPVFRRCGTMLDFSRNAVLTVPAVCEFLRRMALMGQNVLMLYTEDTYEVPGVPYFGWQRGAYTQQELRQIDDYADALGIEVVPCIQTLGHLEKALRWAFADEVKDTPDILMVGSEKTLALLRQMIRAITTPLRSRRIHLGMDEAHALGLGRYLEQHGYHSSLELMREHLRDLRDICREMGLAPMIWSDMCLRLLSTSHDYYEADDSASTTVPPEVAAAVPDEISLVYWDYYHDDPAVYERLIRRHKSFSNPVIFAGGSWTWNGFTPCYGKAFATTRAALPICRQEGVEEILCTCWGDNGQETNLIVSLLPMQLFAEYAYGEPTDDESVFARFAACCGGNGADFYALRLLDETPGAAKNNPENVNPSKWLLYEDALLGTFDHHLRGWNAPLWYEMMGQSMREAEARNPLYAGLFRHYATLADALEGKALLAERLAAHYANGDREDLREDLSILEGTERRTLALLETSRALWFSNCKPQGFEVIDIRISGVAARLRSARMRIEDYLDGRIERIEELEAPRLPFNGEDTGKPIHVTYWHRMIGNCPIQTV